jgi:hypothetical protein
MRDLPQQDRQAGKKQHVVTCDVRRQQLNWEVFFVIPVPSDLPPNISEDLPPVVDWFLVTLDRSGRTRVFFLVGPARPFSITPSSILFPESDLLTFDMKPSGAEVLDEGGSEFVVARDS